MKTFQIKLNSKSNLEQDLQKMNMVPHLLLVFGHTKYFMDGTVAKLSSHFKTAVSFGCSTAGEISNDGLVEDSLQVSCIEFDSTRVKAVASQLQSPEQSYEVGRKLAAQIDQNGLRALLVLSPGVNVNGDHLIAGLNSLLHDKYPMTGGLAGDGADFKRTFTLANQNISDDQVVVLGFYGEHFEMKYGFMGGWESFGSIKKITKAKDNVVYEIDHQPALDVYKKYLGEHAKQFPANALMFPLSLLKDKLDQVGIVRAVLGADEGMGSLTFGGNVPEGSLVKLMNAKKNELIQGAKKAASLTLSGERDSDEGLGILISCVARKLVLGIDTEDELDAVKEVFGHRPLAGFYSYGEICPSQGFMECQLHNQTMTISYLSEKKSA